MSSRPNSVAVRSGSGGWCGLLVVAASRFYSAVGFDLDQRRVRLVDLSWLGCSSKGSGGSEPPVHPPS